MDKFKIPEEQPPEVTIKGLYEALGLDEEEVKALRVTIKGLYEALGLDEEEVKALREKEAENALRRMAVYWKIVSRGGNIHRVDRRATAKRRAANKAARKQRKANR